jgi:hypothetical protein
VTTANSLQTTANTLNTTANSLLTAINSILNTMNSQLVVQSNTLGTIQQQNAQIQIMSDRVERVRQNLTSVVPNTARTALAVNQQGISGAGITFATFRYGGFVPGVDIGRDSIRALLTPGEFVVPRPIAQLPDNRSALPTFAATGRWPANDNGVWLSELRALRAQNERMERMIGSLLSRIAQLEEQGNDAIRENTQATREQTSDLNRETRMAARKKAA